jgi:hypothetical protein
MDTQFNIGDDVIALVDVAGYLTKGTKHTVIAVTDKGVTVKGITNAVFSAAAFELSQIKPPFGLRPRYILDGLRMQEILEAATRFASTGKYIPKAWIDELIELNDKNVK